MDDRQLELIVQKLASSGSEKSHTSLAQLILAGRPELKERLFQPPLRSLGSMVALECKLAALTAKEVGDYIAHRLQLANLEPRLFDNDAVQQVATYSDGKIGTVNTICDRVLEMADGSPRKLVDAQLIDAAAKDLNLWKPRWVRNEAPRVNFAMPKESHSPADFESMHDTTESVGQTFINFNDNNTDSKAKVSRAAGSGRTLRIVSIIVLLGISAVWLQSTPPRKYLDEWSVMLGEVIGNHRQITAPAKTEADVPPLPATEELIAPAPELSTNDPQPQPEKQKASDLTYPEMEKLAQLPAPVQPPLQQETPSVEQSIPTPQKAPARAVPQRPTSPREDSDQQRRELAAQVSKAIANRAIPGIDVSVIDGTAYLNGRVATERQRTAAERAALTVPDVRYVRNRITIE
jgi:hypothetical protein